MTTTVVVDPRLRARRIEVLRAQGRRRLRFVVVSGVLLVVGLAVLVALRSPLFDVDHVRVLGAEQTSVRAVLETAAVSTGQPLAELDTDGIAAAVETLPWVAEVRVRKDWPGAVEIEVVERKPAAVIARGDELVLVDQAGWILAATALRPADLAVVELSDGTIELVPGEQLATEELSALVLASRAPDALRLAPGVVRHDRGDLVWVVPGVGRLRFGTLADLDAKFVAAAAVLERLGGVVGGELDLREPSAVVRRSDVAPAPPPTGAEPETGA